MIILEPTRDYVDVTYSEIDYPFTQYPSKLAKYLTDRYALSEGSRLLELGCGRGETLKGFIDAGLVGHGVDLSPVASK